MVKEIKIFNANEKPFGCLSNNYSNYYGGNGKQKISFSHDFKVSAGKPCNTLTNYIYASLLEEEIHRQIVCYQHPNNAKSSFHKQQMIETSNKVKKAAGKALKSMFERNETLRELLLSTGNRKIKYLTEDNVLGTGSDGKGRNDYGVLLEQERTNLLVEINKKRKQIDKKSRDKNIYEIFLAYRALTSSIKNGDNLQRFFSKTPTQIVDMYGREDLEQNSLTPEQHLENVQKGIGGESTKYIDNPGNMVHAIRKEMLSELRISRLREKKKQIFSMYADYLLAKKNIKKEDYEEAKNQQFSGKKFLDQATDLEDRLYNLFEQGMLSDRLSTDIDEHFKSEGYYIPTEEEVEEAKKYQLSVAKKPNSIYPTANVSSDKDPVFILDPSTVYQENLKEHEKYVPFSQLSFCNPLLIIDGLPYQTVSHYIIEQLMTRLGIKEARSYILKNTGQQKLAFHDPRDAMKVYEEKRYAHYRTNLIKYAKEGLKKKFQDRSMQDYLLATGDAILKYNDPNDDILGTGDDGQGENEVGKYLMQLRYDLTKERKKEELDILTTSDITIILSKNAFMKDWVAQRVRDSCRTLLIMNDYVKEKLKTKISMSAKFVEAAIDNIYQPCSQIYGASHKIKAEVPEYFIDLVKNCIGMETASNDIINVLWKRMAVIIYHIIIHLKDSGAKIEKISSEIGRVQVLTSENIPCENIVSDDYENCIIIALVNLIRGIIRFNKQISGKSTNVTNEEVKTATSIILEIVAPVKFTKKFQDEKEITEEIFDFDTFVDELVDKKVDESFVISSSSGEGEGESEGEVKSEGDGESEGEGDGESGDESDGINSYASSDGVGSNFSPQSDKTDNIIQYLKGFTDFDTDEDFEDIAIAIQDAVKFIKSNSKKIRAATRTDNAQVLEAATRMKRNRVNFFARQK
jgi:predicted NAD-dependent protein-ADP-ribosyltransferase YbiA (DUF1768 family)